MGKRTNEETLPKHEGSGGRSPRRGWSLKGRVWPLSLFALAIGCSPYVAPPLGLDHPANPSAREPAPPSPSQILRAEPSAAPSAPKEDAFSGHERHDAQGMPGMPGMPGM